MVHYVVEIPSAREEFLKTLWSYSLKKRKEPEFFTRIVNTVNTKGETLLDYIESLKLRGDIYSSETLNTSIPRIITIVCKHGGVYSRYNKSCSDN